MARICVLTQDPGFVGGVGTKLRAFLRFAELRGHVCDIYYPFQRGSRLEAALWVKRYRSTGAVWPVRTCEELPHFARAIQFAHGCRPAPGYDAYQLVTGSPALALPFARRNLPFVAWIAGTVDVALQAIPRTKLRHYYLYNRWCRHLIHQQEVYCGSKARAVMTVSSHSARTARQRLGLPEHIVRVVHPAVDSTAFRPGERVVHPRPYIVSVGRLMRGKGFPDLLRAMRLVADAIPHVELRIVGDGKERAHLERLTQSLSLEDRVVFKGELTGRELVAEYRGASLFAFASHQEAFGIVFIEASACGLPVVATECGGSTDPIVHGHTGFLVPVGDWRALAEHVIRVLSDPALAQALGHAGRQKMVAEYGEGRISREFDAVYEEVFGVRPSCETAVQ